jgi:hypothetical protein
MTSLPRILLVSLLLPASLTTQGAGSRWVDSVSATAGRDNNSNKTDIYRLGMQNKWNRTWFDSGAWFVGGYWDLSLAYWDSNQDSNRHLYDLSLTPVVRLQRDAEISSGVTPFSEIGVGGHLLTDQKIGNRDLATTFQFGSHIGVGLGFGDKGRYELAYRFQHLSNASIKDPNDGIELHLLSVGYNFQ